MKRIHDSLNHAFGRHRLVFWYDSASEWRKAFESFELAGVEKLIVAKNDFGTKVHILSAPSARFLVYSASSRPPDSENWLLDLVLQGHEFKADRPSLSVQEAGLTYEFRPMAEQHADFFREAKRVESLKEIVTKDDGVAEIRLKMMALLLGTSVDLDAVLLEFLKRSANGDIFDPVEDAFGPSVLVVPFWREVSRLFGYTPTVPTIRDFVATLFRGANPLEKAVVLPSHAKVFLQRWKDSQAHCPSFRKWSSMLETDLQIAYQLDTAGDRADLGEADTFEIFEKFLIHRLCREFEDGASANDILAKIHMRRHSFWYPQHEHGYGAIRQSVVLRELIASSELNVDFIDTGIERYRTTWWKVDQAYRRVCYHLRRYGQVNVMEKLDEWANKVYVNNFLLPLNDRWSDKVRDMESWTCSAIPSQKKFFELHVRPYIDKGQKVFVIISDALRYEAAAEFAERMNSENRFTAEMNAMLSSLPSYTQLGMASLLPGSALAIDPDSGVATVDDRSATGTENRSDILNRALKGRGTAIQAEHFIDLNTKNEGRALMREHDVIYIFHNVIDKIGDALATEAKTVDAVEQAFDELLNIVKKVANINANNMLLVSDHGFLFQQDDVHEGDDVSFPTASAWTYRNRRFSIGKAIQPSNNVKVFNAGQLGLPGDWSCAFPVSLGRFPIQGSGKRYVHGGFSLQEVIVPVVHINKARSDDTGRVAVELMRVPSKITTGQVAISLFQEKPVTAKLLARELRVGVFAPNGAPLSEVKSLKFDSIDDEARKREVNVILVLSRAADDFNNKLVEIRLEETLPGTSQAVTFKSHSLKLQKPFANDFDET
jgi:uncharacterized protein (TIGR02687 family)